MSLGRGLVAVIALAVLGSSMHAGSQSSTKLNRIGWLSPGDAAGADEAIADFRQGLRDLKYVDGQNVTVEYRHAGGSVGRLGDFADELVRQRVDVIVTVGDAAALAARRATNAVPIVATELGQDPVKAGLVASLSRPGGNLTGLATQSDELWEKRLGLLKQMAPRVSRVTVIANPVNPGTLSCIDEIRNGARTLGLKVSYLEASEGAALQRLLGDLANDSANGIAVCWDGLTLANARAIGDFALRQRVPMVAPSREYTLAGALLSFGTNLSAQRRRAAYFVDRILKGAKPADLPVERPTLFELVVNGKTARMLGLTLPAELLIITDDVVE